MLEAAGLVISRREGREKLHFLNAVPIRLIHDRWIDKFTERQVSALVDLKTTLDKKMDSGKKRGRNLFSEQNKAEDSPELRGKSSRRRRVLQSHGHSRTAGCAVDGGCDRK
jgi:hypothetical protein